MCSLAVTPVVRDLESIEHLFVVTPENDLNFGIVVVYFRRIIGETISTTGIKRCRVASTNCPAKPLYIFKGL